MRNLEIATCLMLAGYLCADIAIHAIGGQAMQPPSVVVRPAASEPAHRVDYVGGTRPLLAPPPPTRMSTTSSSPWDQRPMTLLGTLVSNDTALAVIMSEGKQYTIERGQFVGTWRVAAISDMDVSLRKGSQVRKLTLPSLAGDRPAPVEATPSLVTRLGPRSVMLDRILLEQRLQQPQTDIRMDPIERDKRTQFRFTYLDPTGLFGQLGFRQGDILVAVNGRDITSLDDSVALLPALETESHVDVTVLREARPVSLSIDIR